MKNIAFIGGDKREKVIIEKLAKKNYKINILSTEKFIEDKNITYFSDLKQVIKNQDIIFASMAGTDENGILNNSFLSKKISLDEYFFKSFPDEAVFLIGIAKAKIKKILQKEKIKYIEMAREENIAVLNAIPTAEGAIKILIEETNFTIFGSKIMIFGLGKVGFTLAWRLKALGAEVFAVTRSPLAIARGRDIGLHVVNYKNVYPLLQEINIYFNTVPALIVDKNYIKYMKKNSYFYDLASSPGGIDFEEAHKNGIKAKLLPGLPGKTAPDFAGEILADNIDNLVANAQNRG